MGTIFSLLVLAILLVVVGPYVIALIFLGLTIWLGYRIYETVFFKSEKFNNVRLKIQDHIVNCNELNSHIEDLKDTYINANLNRVDYGTAEFVDSSQFNYKRPELRKKTNDRNTYNCSRSVASNAEQQPFKYLCKYFDIKANEETIEVFEDMLNNFSAAENGKQMLLEEKNDIIKSIETEIPSLIRKFSMKKLEKKLGFEEIDLSDSYFPRFVFQYVSPAGNSSYATEIVLNNDNLERFIKYLADQVKFKKSVQGQRQLMTQKLRETIKERDNYTCKYCGVSIEDEPHLLLEIDHIKPLSKGGLTEESNLQTLCWKCNRKKSNK